ncbi:MAG: ornithine carbamoyltransferase [Nitrososphaerota archaeon]|nr:ornithine carbamoyltransferase [Nitrososphaerota archaeon]
MEKDFLSMSDLTKHDVNEIFTIASRLKMNKYGRQLEDKVLALFFEKPSTRTRLSFEAGIRHLGGSTIYLDAVTTQISRGESLEDTARMFERFVDGLIARVYKHQTLETIAKYARIPVINALSDKEHPCQVLSDLFTIKEKKGRLEDQKIAFIGDGNNVCNSLLLGCGIMGIPISVATPPEFRPSQKIIELLQPVLKDQLVITSEPEQAVRDASVVYTDVFVSMGDEATKEKRLSAFLPKYQVNQKLMSQARNGAIFMHCLPAHRGEEVQAEVIDGSQSVVFDQAENRMHVQKALLLKMFNLISYL